jgi:hypothetical protein
MILSGVIKGVHEMGGWLNTIFVKRLSSDKKKRIPIFLLNKMDRTRNSLDLFDNCRPNIISE